MKKRMLCGILCLMLVVGVLTGCSNNEPSHPVDQENTPIKLIAAHINTEDSSFHVGMEAFKEKVEELSDGNIIVEVHGNGTLGGNENELVEKIATGTVDIAVAAPNFIASIVPEADLFSIPYLYEDGEHWEKVVTGEVGDSIANKILDGSDFKVMSYWQCGTRQYFGTKPVTNMDDLKGVKIRVHNSETIQSVWSTLGAQPTTLAYNELYSGLQNNVIDAAENDLGNILLQKFYEAGKYISLTEHDIATRFFVISESKYNNLTDEQKSWIDEAAETSQVEQWKYDRELQDMAKEEIEAKGGVFNEVDTEEFAEATYEVRLEAAKKLGVEEEFEKIRSLKNN
jgi:tripartite ATP-independent transporter DctP family solute receptor